MLSIDSSGAPQYDFTLVTTALVSAFLFLVAAPVAHWVALANMGLPTARSALFLVCVHGYAMSSFLVAALLCAIPVVWLQWLLFVLAALNASAFSLQALLPLLDSAVDRWRSNQDSVPGETLPSELELTQRRQAGRRLLAIVVLGTNVVFAVAFRLFFFL